ncbi:hypothetical protein CAPTEDRAFT_175372 [Capitella teleta]|uniref:PX domain-containing protein n=1 Tax=Capitella teleta TaxID=283909 RepID=R7TNN3_CAPTE|nr:hypothetical protein CAPTEDRAFT_175372 [Capitella teleta]|eukprot:ELT93151.1 hypothetical protein CAPTEDRAFT_175372 [Capitella teleta]
MSTGNLEAALGKPTEPSPGPSGVTFQVINVRIVREGHHKYVLYSIVILKANSGLDEDPIVIDRRYSDFERLNQALRKKSPLLMRGIAFPKKKITGNFKSETIAARSRAFEQFLTHIFSTDSLRVLTEFSDFFYGHTLREAYQKLVNGAYAEAIPLFKTSLGVQRKLQGDFHHHVLTTLCALTACAYSLERFENAHLFSESALECLGGCQGRKYTVPLIELSIRLCWQLGKEKVDLENRLKDLRAKGHVVDGAPSLLEVVVSDFMPSSS